MIYFDNAATSWPKPESVYEAVDRAMRQACGNPGRSGHKLSLAAGRVVEDARLLCARLFNTPSAENIILTCNATAALNLAIKGILQPGDHVITSTLEHNSVARPLYELSLHGVEVTKAETSFITGLDLNEVEKAVKPNTRMVICSHISNVTGTVSDIGAIGSFCRSRNILFLVDAAQSAGSRPIDVLDMNIDLLAFPGHKGLFGPQGTGGLYIKPGLTLRPLMQGGTGSRSESLQQPDKVPVRYESGTHNTPGLAGLAAGIRFILDTGIERIMDHETQLTARLLDGISEIPGITLYGPLAGTNRGSVVSVTFRQMESSEIAIILDASFDIAVRAGLHCAPDTHRAIHTLEKGGTLRISLNYFNTEKEVDLCLEALRSITTEGE